jgi:hypothetical protein
MNIILVCTGGSVDVVVHIAEAIFTLVVATNSGTSDFIASILYLFYIVIGILLLCCFLSII